MTTGQPYDYLIIGGGIIGMTIAWALRNRDANVSIAILEKEHDVGQHASGRNSGVLHAGFYYTADSLKAKLTAEGNRRMKAFCKTHNLPINECQKIVVAKNADELAGLATLYQRGLQNGVEVELINEAQVKAMDPNVKTYQKALLSPNTASVDPKAVCAKLKTLLIEKGVVFYFNQQVAKIKSQQVITKTDRFGYGHLINAAGLYADRLAHQMGIGKDYVMMPFKGIYLKYQGDSNIVTTNIYPVPNLQNPFLGVHFTKTVNGDTKIGPTAIPALWREHYRGLRNFKLNEFLQTLYYQIQLCCRNAFHFRQLAWHEMRKYHKPTFIRESQCLVNDIDPHFKAMPAGIRAQLLNKKTYELVMDFVIESGPNSTHILNAVSPAFTCSFAFAEYVVDRIA